MQMEAEVKALTLMVGVVESGTNSDFECMCCNLNAVTVTFHIAILFARHKGHLEVKVVDAVVVLEPSMALTLRRWLGVIHKTERNKLTDVGD